MPKFFISYSRVDKHFVAKFEPLLRRIIPDSSVWYDDKLDGGDKWWDEILKQIAECDIFLYLLSNESVQSVYCQAEFTEACRLQKNIITIQIRDRTELTDELKDIHYIDMTDGVDDADAIVRLAGAIHKQLENTNKRRALWKPSTPKPSTLEEKLVDRTTGDTNTPKLTQPHHKKTWGSIWKNVIIIAFVLPITVTVIGNLLTNILLCERPVIICGLPISICPPIPMETPQLTAIPTETPQITLSPTETSQITPSPTETSQITPSPTETPQATTTLPALALKIEFEKHWLRIWVQSDFPISLDGLELRPVGIAEVSRIPSENFDELNGRDAQPNACFIYREEDVTVATNSCDGDNIGYEENDVFWIKQSGEIANIDVYWHDNFIVSCPPERPCEVMP